MTTPDNNTIVLLHGIFRGKSSMSGMERGLAQKGYDVLNIGYPSLKKPIEELIDDVHAEIARRSGKGSGMLHFVGHSLGGLVIRAYLHKFRPENLGRVVMLGTPNHGSEIADIFASFLPYKMFYGPAGQQLVTDQSRFENIFGSVDYDLGVIAGDKSFDPVMSWFIPGADDGRVSVARTKLDGMKDHLTLHITHTFMPSKK
ncbi:MAG: alpha/beta fold hydrolase, partial [Alphaproteobacteria bacterium]|nr:alpha/beta fold hydrolase [Alphaproteobacteria bacterium]